jgi:hypothetical protein
MKILLALIILVSFGCVTNRQLTREEWEITAQRKYTNIDKIKLINAAETVMKLADKDDFLFSYTPNGVNGTRKWMMYMLIAVSIGTDYWSFEVSENKGVSTATLQLSRQAGDMTAYPSGAGGGIVTSPNIGAPATETASYDLFWRRMDYVLGLSKTWTTCEDEDEIMKTNKNVWGNVSFLCNSLTISNYAPDNLSNEDIDRVFRKNIPEKWKYIKRTNPSRWEEAAARDPEIRKYGG